MNRDEAIHVLEHISLIYPRAQMSEKRANILLPSLMEMDYDGVMKNVTKHAAMSPYAPSLAEIAAYPKMPNPHLETMKQWKSEAATVSEQTKQQFYEAIQKLVWEKEKVNHEQCKL